MSHLDDLDEFEAELELTAEEGVHGRLRPLPLLRPDRRTRPTSATSSTCRSHRSRAIRSSTLKMEDVWVWDKNRPTRIIPRAEVYTSSDVTVEELRGEGDEPKLTAEALAERLGERHLDGRRHALERAQCCWPSTSATRRRCFGLFEGERLAEQLPARDRPRARTGDELGVMLAASSTSTDARRHLPLLDGAALVREYERVAERWARCAARSTVGPGVKTGIPIRYDDPREVGPDRIVERRRRARALRRAVHRRRLRHRRPTSTSSRRRASTSAACSRRGSRSRWTRSSPARRASSKVDFVEPPSGDRQDDGRPRSSPGSSTASPARWTGSSSGSGASSGAEAPDGRDRRASRS